MSKRMTQERLTWFRLQRATLDAQGLRADDHVKELHDEVERARASEQALADAAEEMNGAIILLIDGDARAVDAIAQSAGRLTEALRLAGRLP